MPAQYSDSYALDLRGLGVVWYSRPEHVLASSALVFGDPGPERRQGIIGVGSTLRSSIGLLDSRSRPGGLSVTLSADTALELLREGGDTVKGPGGRTVWAVIPHDEYWSEARNTLWFREARAATSTPLSLGERYIVGTEVVQIVGLGGVLNDAREYTVTRGERGSEQVARPIYWPEGSDLLDSADGLRSQIYTQIDPVYPDLSPPTLTGWPARVWRFTASGGEVIFDGSVSRVRSQGAQVTVELASRVQAEIDREWRQPWGGMLFGIAPRFGRATPVLRTGYPTRFPGNEVFGIGSDSRGSVRRAAGGLSTRGPIVGVPASSLPSADLSKYGAVMIRYRDAWALCRINAWLTQPVDVDVDGVTLSLDDDRFHFAELADEQREGGALVLAHGEGDVVRGLNPRNSEWLRTIGIEPDLIQFSGVELLRVQLEQLDQLPEGVTPCYLVPLAGDEEWAPGVLPASVQEALGGRFRYADIGGASDICLRSPHWGRSVGEVIDAQLGAQGKAFSVSPTGDAEVIDWIGLPPASVASIVADDLRDTTTLEIGQPGRISRLELEVDGVPVALEIVGRSLSPRGVEIERAIDSVLFSRDAESVQQWIAWWASALGVYRGTIPVARFSLRDDGTGKVGALRPGALVSLDDPACPAADGTRGFSGSALVIDVSVGTEGRTAQVTALLQAYGRPAPARWGPTVRVDTGGTGTSISVGVVRLAVGRGIERFRELLAFAPVPLQRFTVDGPVADPALSLTALDESGSGTVTAAASVTIATGDFLTLAEGPAPAALPFASGYYGASEYR